MTKITEHAHRGLRIIRDAHFAWYCTDAAGVVVAVKQYRAEASALRRAGGCEDYFCPEGPLVLEVMPARLPHPSVALVIQHVPRQAQRQDATNDQLRDLRDIATWLGAYDAADVLRTLLEKTQCT